MAPREHVQNKVIQSGRGHVEHAHVDNAVAGIDIRPPVNGVLSVFALATITCHARL
jgi:hypothetical protein